MSKARSIARVAVLSLIGLVWVVLPLWMLLVNSAKPLAEELHQSGILGRHRLSQ